jgi:hypothetical protein
VASQPFDEFERLSNEAVGAVFGRGVRIRSLPGCEQFGSQIRNHSSSSIGRMASRQRHPSSPEAIMTLWQKLFSRKAEPRQRVRVCVECGMPIAEHKDWCSILRTQREYEAKAAAQKAQ